MAKTEKLDGYTLTERMRKTRRKHPMTASEQALFHELVAICNEDSWADVFSCSNYDLCSPLQMSENTLDKARNRLIQVGLIFYKSGKSRRVHGQYSFVKKFSNEKTTAKTTANFEAENGVNNGMDLGVNNGMDLGVKGSDIYKEQTKTKEETKLNNSKSHSSPDGEVEKIKIQYWKKFIDVWFLFFGEKFKHENGVAKKPRFKSAQAKHLKDIVEHLQKICNEASGNWSEANAIHYLRGFLEKAWNDDWLQKHFELKNLVANIDSITNSKKDNGKSNITAVAKNGNSANGKGKYEP